MTEPTGETDTFVLHYGYEPDEIAVLERFWRLPIIRLLLNADACDRQECGETLVETVIEAQRWPRDEF